MIIFVRINLLVGFITFSNLFLNPLFNFRQPFPPLPWGGDRKTKAGLPLAKKKLVKIGSSYMSTNLFLKMSPVGYIDEMITGLLLSDGTLVKKYTGGGTYFQIVFFCCLGFSKRPKKRKALYTQV